MREVHGAGQSGFNGSSITDAVQAAVLGELAVVDCEDDIRINPTPVVGRNTLSGAHFASARSTSRSSCMISSANFIWRSKSGL